MKPQTTGLSVAGAIAKIFARDGVVPKIVVNPNAPPSWDSKNGIISLPALPTTDLTAQQVSQLRAYFWHESQGEQSMNTWHDRPEIAGNKQRHRLANGVGDAFIDRSILEQRPGAGVDIRQAVLADCTDFLSKGHEVNITVGLASIAARYILEGVTSWPQIRSAIPQAAEFFDKIEPVIPDGTVPRSGDHVVELTLALDAALEEYKRGDEPESPEGGESGSEGQQGGKKDKSPKGKKGKKDESPEDQPKGPVDKLRQSDDGEDSEADPDSTPADPDSQSDGEGDDESEGQPSGGSPADSDDDDEGEDSEAGGDGDDDSDDDDDSEAGGTGQSSGGQSGGNRDEDDESDSSGGASSGGTQESAARQNARELEDGEDSGDRMADQLGQMLRGDGDDSNPGLKGRTFDERFRTVVWGKDLDAWGRRHNFATHYVPSEVVRRDAGTLANRLRAALVGPTMKMERGQEYGRFDARRGAMALAGSRTVYSRRRELPADSVAVSFAWDESGSMGSKMPAVKAITERFALALKQLPNVSAEFTGWTDGFGAQELGNSSDQLGSEELEKLTESRNESYLAGAHTAAGEGGDGSGYYAQGTAVHRVYKSFDEAPHVIGPRLSQMRSRSGTPMAEGLAFSVKRLAARPEQRKVMFFLTDGEADDTDTSVNAAWGYNALEYEVERAAANGVDVVVFDISSDYPKLIAEHTAKGDRHMVQMFQTYMKTHTDQFGPKARMIFLDSDDNFMQPIFNQLTSLLTRKSRAA